MDASSAATLDTASAAIQQENHITRSISFRSSPRMELDRMNLIHPDTHDILDPENRLLPHYRPARSKQPHSVIPLAYRASLRSLILILALAVTGTLAYVVILRSSTRSSQYMDTSGNSLASWPSRIRMQPTVVLLFAASLSASINSVFLVAECAKV